MRERGIEEAIRIRGLTHRYGERVALSDVELTIESGEIFGLLGPNGGGKTTLFKILATLVRPQEGSVQVFGQDVSDDGGDVRSRLGVVFQRPSLDAKLTAWENLLHQGHLYGLRGRGLRERMDEALARARLSDRRDDRVETLSGGLQRRVELAKSLLHRPQLLVFDEPSTGLDPGARRTLWDDLTRLRQEEGVTVVLTTHFLEEAERCDRIAILADGRVIAVGTPGELKADVGGDVITIASTDAKGLAEAIGADLGRSAEVVDATVRLAARDAEFLLPELYARYRERIESLRVGHPTLEDVFIQKTGRPFHSGEDESDEG